MICKNCGKQLNDSAKFCPECGAKLEDQIEAEPSFLSGGEDTMLLADDSTLNENFGDEDTMLLTEDDSTLNENFGDESTMLLTEDDSALNENFGDESTMLLTEDDSALNENFGDESTMLLTEDDSALNENSGDESTMLLKDEAHAQNDNFGSEDTMLLSGDDNSDYQGGLKNNAAVAGAAASQTERPDVSTGAFGNTDPFGAQAPAGAPGYGSPEPASTAYPRSDQPEPYTPPYIRQQGESAPPPYYDAPAGYEAPQKPKKRKIGGGRLFVAAIFSIITFACTLALSLAASLRFGADGKSLEKSIRKLDADIILSAEFDGDELSDDIYKTLGVRGLTDGSADKENFKKYLSDSNALEYIGAKVRNYAEYFMEGKGSDPSVTSEEISSGFFGDKNNNKIAQREFGMKFGSSELKKIAKNMQKNDVDENLSVKKWNDKSGFDLKNIKYAVSYVSMGIVLAVILVFLIWIALIVDRRGKHLAGFYGKIFGISGIIMFIIGVAVLAASPIIYAVTGNIIFYLVFHVLMKFGIIAIGTGFVELLIAFLLKRVKRSIKAKEKTAKAVEAARVETAEELQLQN